MRRVFWCRCEWFVKWGSCYGWCPASRDSAADRTGDPAAGIPKFRTGRDGLPWYGFRVPATRVFSLHVVQAGSAGRGRRPGLPRQRSTELVRSSGRPGRAAQGLTRGWPLRQCGLALPVLGEEGQGHPQWCGRMDALVRPPRAGSAGRAGRRRRRRRPRRPSWCRGRPWSRSSAARRPRTPPGPWRAARGPRPPPGPAAAPHQPPRPAAWVIAAYLAAMTGLCCSIGHTARQAVSRSPGRPRRDMCAWPSKAPEAFSDGDSPACLTREDELS